MREPTHDREEPPESSGFDISRRTFLIGVGAGGAGAIVGYRPFTDKVEALSADEVDEWDREDEVVVVGYGTAGSAAAIEAARAGASVLAIDQTESGGGAIQHAGGVVLMGGGTPLQEAVGVEDSVENLKNYLYARHPYAEQDRIDSFAEGSLELYDWLTEMGISFPENYVDYKIVNMPGGEGGLYYSSASGQYPYNEAAEPAARGHHVEEGGSRLWGPIDEAAREEGVEFLFETEANRLITDGDRVVGIRVTAPDGEMDVRATRSVVLATGGFDSNEELVRRHDSQFADTTVGVTVVPIHTGVGIRMAESVGAQLSHMGQMWAWGPNIYQDSPGGDGQVSNAMLKSILVNGNGDRFINEDLYFGDYTTDIIRHHGGVAYLVADEAIIEEAGGVPDHLTYIDSADSIAGIEELVDIPEAALEGTIETYNAHAEEGTDAVHHKDEHYVQPLDTPPYHVFDFTTAENNFALQTLGGIRTTPDGEVYDAFDDLIPGLRAAPRGVDGIPGYRQDSGFSLATCLHFGRMAGQSAAAASGIDGASDDETDDGEMDDDEDDGGIGNETDNGGMDDDGMGNETDDGGMNDDADDGEMDDETDDGGMDNETNATG